MKQRIFAIAAIIFCIILGWYAWTRWKQARAEQSGDVQLVDSGSSSGDTSSNDKVVVDKDELDRLRAAADKPPTVVQASAPEPAESAPSGIPISDSIPANPPNGARFTGSGRYQLYRQGSLTWRLDSESGQTCIIFATDEEWRKSRVYSHGCND